MAENELRRHKIRAELYDNLLTEDPNDFAARVVDNLRISGSKIRIAGENAENGVYFVNQETNERVKVSSKIPVNKPSELMVVIPALAAGTYKLEVVTQFTGGTKTLLKEPRTAVFDKVLTAA